MAEITVAEYLASRGKPATWQYASPFGRIAAEIYREHMHREPHRAFRLINGKFRLVKAYGIGETFALDLAWLRYPRTTPPVVPAPRRPISDDVRRAANDVWLRVSVSGDAMRWTPGSEPIARHP